MSKRSRRRESGGLADSLQEGLQDTPSLEDASDAIFGITPFPAIPQVKVKMVEITSIVPDLSQPRRAIPSGLRAVWDPIQDPFEDLINKWLNYMGKDFDLEAYLLDGETRRAQQDPAGEPVFSDFSPHNAIQNSFLRLL